VRKTIITVAAIVATVNPVLAQQSVPPAAAIPGQSEGPAAAAVGALAPVTVDHAQQPLLSKGTLVRLMVLKEVNSRSAKAGDRFVLRVDEEVKAGEKVLIPIGAKAWGEVVSADGTGGLGKSGRLNAKLLYVEVDGRKIPVDGERNTKARGAADRVVAGVLAFGIFGLLMKGNNATLKAGEILNGYTVGDEAMTSPASSAS
jgi:hypothetical protein